MIIFLLSFFYFLICPSSQRKKLNNLMFSAQKLEGIEIGEFCTQY